MSDFAIKVEDVSKLYRLGTIGTGSFKKDLLRFWHKSLGKDDPFAKIGVLNDRTKKSDSDWVWALKDINFEVKKGEVLGIIGRNGAGKSTLLKILSKITTPSRGQITINGRIASLLEVGTGFHPELSGRDNIFLNGAILGMRKWEIQKKFDEIVDFSGVQAYIDTPVKRYSSGMYVRLAFAVAAFLEPEILIVDEVLAVGDAEFQKKCLGRMNDVSKNQGRTVLFVSHNMGAIQKLCGSALLLQNGTMVIKSKTEETINVYLDQAAKSTAEFYFKQSDNKMQIAFTRKVVIRNGDGEMANEIPTGKPWKVEVYFTVNHKVDSLVIGLGMVDLFDTPIRTCWSESLNYEPGDYMATFLEERISFNSGQYKFLVGLSKGAESIEYLDADMFLTISEVIYAQDSRVINNRSGWLLNQMNISIESE
jgi:ABC-type polysaccharide/polyol phosphate transport system ATPase subunit